MSIASKNLYELLGNDPDQDPELREPEPPTKAIDKPTARTGKRNVPAEAPSRTAPSTGRGGQRDMLNANENAFRDRGVGSDRNRNRGSGAEAVDGGPRGGYRGARRGRGAGRGGAMVGDRHSRTGVADHEKQVAHGWGGQDGSSEWADEKAGEAIAQQEEKEGVIAEGAAAVADEPAAELEPEDKTKSYAAYLAEQADKKLSLGIPEIRKANEGSNKKFPEGKAISRDEDEDFIAGSGGKAKRERQRKEKALVELDDSRLHNTARESFRGGRGRGRGEFRGGEGRGRGGRGRGEGRSRGGRGGQTSPNVSDTSAFPSLGA
ncbi:hypothetical protein CC78DRAFT_532800 [Lojkania enalia]|uniref:Hyaluronan/mRNA-binding protein domain-containing protein n=1 Tax=Lojkania enalia TaxID=147567 RepID=A0A9P4KBX4_9PLEO|nr:hypothetical protein CC78DRAFT_532800 [Didymosphaeria enalia]